MKPAFLLVVALLSQSANADELANVKPAPDLIARGSAVADAADCVACHSKPGAAPYAGGVALETPFGKLVAPNITPDRDTGVGRYDEGDLVRALRDGRGWQGRHLYPAMPYTAYAKMTDEDIHALYAYLATVPPVANAVEANLLPFPFNVRLVNIGWNLLFFHDRGPQAPVADHSAQWNRGRYLVDALGHCGACHTPKNGLGADRDAHYLEGAVLQGWYAPSLTTDPRRGIGGWSNEQLVEYLASGANHMSITSGPMAEAVANSTSRMTRGDLEAIATYLKERPAPPPATVAKLVGNDGRMVAGAAIFKDTCAACHKDDGSGDRYLFPTLAGSAIVQQDDPTTLIRIVLEGSRGGATDARPTAPGMPPLGWRLDDAQVASVLTYVRQSWSNEATAVDASAVAKLRKSLAREAKN